jgi:hypothetical protein
MSCRDIRTLPGLHEVLYGQDEGREEEGPDAAFVSLLEE